MKHLRLLTVLIMLLPATAFAQPIQDTTWKLVSTGFQFPEGPAWAGNHTLYVSNCNSDWIARIQGKTVDTLAMAAAGFGKTNGMWTTPGGSLLACDFGKGAILQISPEGKISTLIEGYQGKPFNRPNDIIQLTNGDLYFTDPKDYGKVPPGGRVFYYSAVNETLTLAADSLNFPNGLAISPLNGKLYVCESVKNRILEYTRTVNGKLTQKRVFIELPEGDPDGIEFDVAGNMYVAHFGSGTLYVISPQGKIMQGLITPGKQPSNLEFGGKDHKTLFITEDETNAVYKIRTTIAGVPLK